jgi:hypothetical protein
MFFVFLSFPIACAIAQWGLNNPAEKVRSWGAFGAKFPQRTTLKRSCAGKKEF